MSIRIDEKCSCGAEFAWTGLYPATANEAAEKWREQHRHVEAAEVGICGEFSQVIGAPERICLLPSGHAGWHSDKRDADWGHRRYEWKV